MENIPYAYVGGSLMYLQTCTIPDDDAFSTETGLKLGRIVGPVCCLWMSSSSTKIRNKKDWWGSPVASPMPKSVPSGGREEDQLLRS